MKKVQEVIGRLRGQYSYFKVLRRTHSFVREQPFRFLTRVLAWRFLAMFRLGRTVHFGAFNVDFFCPAEWRGMSKMAFTLRDDYEPELPAIKDLLDPNAVVVDVGAHYGAWTICLASICKGVHAIEPSQHSLKILERNIRLNSLSNVDVHAVGIGEKDQELTLISHPDQSRASLTFSAEQDQGGQESVQIRRLDGIVHEQVAFIKIDIEGFELPALKGASGIIQRDRPLVLFEIQPAAALRGGIDPFGVWNLLSEFGYVFKQLDVEGNWELLTSPNQVSGSNILAVPL